MRLIHLADLRQAAFYLRTEISEDSMTTVFSYKKRVKKKKRSKKYMSEMQILPQKEKKKGEEASMSYCSSES